MNCLGVDESLEEISGYFGPFRTPSSGLLIRVQLRDGGDHIGPAVEEVRTSPNCAHCAAVVASVAFASSVRSAAARQATNSSRACNNARGRCCAVR